MPETEEKTDVKLAIQYLEEALSGYSSRSKNDLIREALRVLSRIK